MVAASPEESVAHDRHFSLPFIDRDDAGVALGALVVDHAELTRGAPIVVALPRGGVPVAAPVARVLSAPLDVVVVRKLGVPGHPELAMGAIGEDGVRVLEPRVIASATVTEAQLAAVEAHERRELERRAELLRPRIPSSRSPPVRW